MRNKFESRINAELKALGLKVQYEAEKIPYILSCNYIPDFIIKNKYGRKIYIETKGHFRVEDKRKLSAIRKQYPELDLRIIFYSNSKQNIKWANKNNIPYAIGHVPEEWFQ